MWSLHECERCLCIAAHPDDEVLGAGATMASMVDAGVEVNVLILGEGVGARFPGNQRPAAEVRGLARELRDAADVLGVATHQESLPDNRFDDVPMLDVVHIVEEKIQRFLPEVILTHHPGDLNVDHQVTANAVITASRPLPESLSASLLAFPTLSSTEYNVPSNGSRFTPTWFEDASPGLERKIQAMAAYEHEARDWPHPRSPEAIRVAAQHWGSSVGMEAAEPFALLRHVSRTTLRQT